MVLWSPGTPLEVAVIVESLYASVPNPASVESWSRYVVADAVVSHFIRAGAGTSTALFSGSVRYGFAGNVVATYSAEQVKASGLEPPFPAKIPILEVFMGRGKLGMNVHVVPFSE